MDCSVYYESITKTPNFQGYAGFPLLAGQDYAKWTGLSKATMLSSPY